MQPIPQQPIRLSDISENVFLLHQALSALGYPVDLNEQLKREAGTSTLAQVKALQTVLRLPPGTQFLADLPTIDAINKLLRDRKLIVDDCQYRVSGNVVSEKGAAIPYLELVAYDVDLRGAAIYRTVPSLQHIQTNAGFEMLKNIKSGKTGKYNFTFTCDQYGRAERKKADVIVFAIEGSEIVGRSQLIHADDYSSTGEIRHVDVVVSRTIQITTLFDRLMKKLGSFLTESNVSLLQLADSDDQIRFAAQELDEEYRSVQIAAQAEKLRGGDDKLGHELLFALGYQGIRLHWPSVFARKEGELRSAIKEAINTIIIQQFKEIDINAFLARLLNRALEFTLNGQVPDQEFTIDKALSIALPETDQRVQLMEALQDFKSGNFEKFWSDELPKKPAFQNKPELIEALEFSSQLTLLGGNHLPLVEELQVTLRMRSINQLAALKNDDWKAIVRKTGVPRYVTGINEEEKIDRYTKEVQNILHAAFPTTKISSMLRANEIPAIGTNSNQSLLSFLSGSKFDFLTSRVIDHDTELRRIAGVHYEQTKNDLLALQRIFQVSPKPETVNVLMKEGLTSAHAVAGIPEKTFIQDFSVKLGGEEIAFAVHQRAVHITERCTMIALNMQEVTHNVQLALTMDDQTRQAAAEVIQNSIPNYSTLFGSPDICECAHCRSVYSPAAYFVELLRFLHRSGQNGNGESPLTIF